MCPIRNDPKSNIPGFFESVLSPIIAEEQAKIIESSFKVLIEELKLSDIQDDILKKNIQEELYASFVQVFQDNYASEQELSTAQLIEKFKKEHGVKLANAIYLSKLLIFNKLSIAQKETSVNELTQMLTAEHALQQHEDLSKLRSLYAKQVLVNIVLKHLDVSVLANIEKEVKQLAPNPLLSFNKGNSEILKDLQVFKRADTIPKEIPLDLQILTTVTDFQLLIQNVDILRNYFNNNQEDEQFIIKYLSFIAGKEPISSEDQERAAMIVFSAFDSSAQVQEKYNAYVKTVKDAIDILPSANNGIDKTDSSYEGDWVRKNRLLSEDLAYSLKLSFIRNQIFNYPQIATILRVDLQDHNIKLKKAQLRWIGSMIFEQFSFFHNFDADKKNSLLKDFVGKTMQSIVDAGNVEQLPSKTGTLIVQLIYEHGVANQLENKNASFKEGMLLVAIKKFNEIIDDSKSKTLSNSTNYKDIKYACISKLLECDEKYSTTIGVWPKVVANLLGDKVATSLQTVAEFVISNAPAQLMDTKNKEQLQQIEQTIKNIKEQIPQKVLSVFADSAETKEQYAQLQQSLPLQSINTHDGKLKELLEKQLFDSVLKDAVQKEVSGLFESNNDLECTKKRIAIAAMLSNIFAFRCLSSDAQLETIQTLYDYLDKLDGSLATQANKNIILQDISVIIKMIAMQSNLMPFIENSMGFLQKDVSIWQRFKSNITSTLTNHRIQGATAGFIVGTFLSKGRVIGGISGAVVGGLQPKIMDKLLYPLKIFFTPFNYVAKEIMDLYRNPLGRTMANRLIRGSIMAIVSALVIGTSVALLPVLGGGLAVSLGAFAGGTLVIAGVTKLTNMATAKMKILSMCKATTKAKIAFGDEKAQNILNYLNDQVSIIEKLQSNTNQSYLSEEIALFLNNLKADLLQARLLIQAGKSVDFYNTWSNSSGNAQDNLRNKLYQLANYDNEIYILVADDEKQRCHEFANEILTNWFAETTNTSKAPTNTLPNNSLLAFTTNTMMKYNDLLNGLIDINNLILPRKSLGTEGNQTAQQDHELAALRLLQVPTQDERLILPKDINKLAQGKKLLYQNLHNTVGSNEVGNNVDNNLGIASRPKSRQQHE